ncbi:hypothetical protein SISNIDRAFT_460651 [Sistotremastrum niveocremeum HHB9708]|uniref:Uncharacterized protein n=2 Tax=Sistotremastraceae TaxID=3402574 RepID=A0A164NHT5_9AGAM|nr:hypothetical protein SISNIDRAFT_460651 [Sistotremastrum niveocremeum HHB9708]KZT35349.1 hypothetical protein SISSUDRAFT_1051512 [Sistotremastrum suecicum HHB10207 ss-3]
MTSIQHYTTAFSAYYAYFIPSLIGYIVAAPAVLTYWIATHATPPHEDPVSLKTAQDVRRADIRMKLIGFFVALVLVILFGTFPVVYQAGSKDLVVLETVLIGTVLAFGLAISLIVFFGREFTATQFIVRRKIDGNIETDEQHSPDPAVRLALRARLTLLACFSLLWAILSLFLNFRLPIAISAIGVTYALNQNQLPKISMKRFLISYTITPIPLALMSLIMVCVAASDSPPWTPIPDRGTSRRDDAALWMVSWTGWIVAMTAATVYGPLLLTIYRFDYHNFITDHPETESSIRYTLQTSPPIVSPTAGPLGMGVLIPPKSRLPAFPKPYFTVAIGTWSAVHLLAMVWMPILPSVYQFLFAPFVGACALPVVCLAVIGVGWHRRELEILLAYQEEWTIDEKSPIRDYAST